MSGGERASEPVTLEAFFLSLSESAIRDYEELAEADRTWGEDARREELERRNVRTR